MAETAGPMDPAPGVAVRCVECGAGVRVRRYSGQQLTIQWPSPASAMCPRMAERAPGGRGQPDPCSFLRASVDDAVAVGAVPVSRRHEEPTRGHW